MDGDPARTDPPAPPRFGVGKAFATLGLMLGAQFLVGIVGGAIAAAMAFQSGFGLDSLRQMRVAIERLNAPLLLASGMASVLAVALATCLWARPLLRDRTPAGLTLGAPPLRALVVWGLVGAALGAVYLLAARWLVPMRAGTPLGPMTRSVVRGGLDRASWAVIALVIAPPVEEFMYRGLLLRGFAERWRMPIAAAVVTGLFVASHLPETLHYWPATVAILAMALAALAARLRTGRVLAAIVTHTAYNAVIVAFAFGSAWVRGGG